MGATARRRRLSWWAAIAGFVLVARPVRAESRAAAWLRYDLITDATLRPQYDAVSGPVVGLGDSLVMGAAVDELIRCVHSMLGWRLTPGSRELAPAGVVLGTSTRIT